jgi:hypothetical protein
MENFFNRLEICKYNLQNTHNISKKESILNNLLVILNREKNTISIINRLYSFCPESFTDYLIYFNFDILLLLTYDLLSISKIIQLDDNYIITVVDNKFKIVPKE